VIADGLGRAVAFILAPGQAHELPHAVPLLDRLPGVPKWVVADRGHASHAFREHVWSLGARPAIPSKRNEAPVACPEWIYANRNYVERLWARLKECARSQPATKRPPPASWVSSPLQQRSTGSRANRP
jgi:transposase